MTNQERRFKANYNGEPIKENEVMVPFEYSELDAEANCVNKDCIRTITLGGKKFRVIYKAVPVEWAKKAVSALSLVENEELGHYFKKGSVSMDAVRDEYEFELGATRSVEAEIMEKVELDEAAHTFADLVRRLVEKSPKIGYAVLLLNTDIRGEEFHSKMLLTHQPANRIRQQAADILEEGLANFDLSSIKCYKSRNDEYYREQAHKLLDDIMRRVSGQ